MRYLLQTLNSLLDQILNWELRLLHCYVIFTFTVTKMPIRIFQIFDKSHWITFSQQFCVEISDRRSARLSYVTLCVHPWFMHNMYMYKLSTSQYGCRKPSLASGHTVTHECLFSQKPVRTGFVWLNNSVVTCLAIFIYILIGWYVLKRNYVMSINRTVSL